MKKQYKITLCILSLFASIIVSCSSDTSVDNETPNPNIEKLVIQTLEVDAAKVEIGTAMLKINIVGTEKSSILTKGICMNTSGNPTVNDLKFENVLSTENGNDIFLAMGLLQGTNYYAKGYLTTKSGETIYGNEVKFTTKTIVNPPILTTTLAAVWNNYNVTMKANVANYEYLYATNFTVDIGFCYSETNKVPTKADSFIRTTSNTRHLFNASVEKLKPNTTYYCRAFANRNSDLNVFYGNVLSFTTAP